MVSARGGGGSGVLGREAGERVGKEENVPRDMQIPEANIAASTVL